MTPHDVTYHEPVSFDDVCIGDWITALGLWLVPGRVLAWDADAAGPVLLVAWWKHHPYVPVVLRVTRDYWSKSGSPWVRFPGMRRLWDHRS